MLAEWLIQNGSNVSKERGIVYLVQSQLFLTSTKWDGFNHQETKKID